MQIVRQQAIQRVLLIRFTAILVSISFLWSYYPIHAANASFVVTPSTARQNETVTLIGQGFSPAEKVAIWVTYPDSRVFDVTEIETNQDGDFNYPYVPDFLGSTFTPTGDYMYTAYGKKSGRKVQTDLSVDIGAAPGASSGIVMSAMPGKDTQGSYFVIRGEHFGSEEEISVWLRYPDYTIEGLEQIKAGPNGTFEYVLRMNGVPIGRYVFTAYGIHTDLTGMVEFDVHVNDLTEPEGAAHLHITPTVIEQRQEVVFAGTGFQAGETVSVWVTLPDFSTDTIGDVVADESGAFDTALIIDEQVPIGKHTFTAFGNTSKLRATADLTLKAGDVQENKEPHPNAICSDHECVVQ